MTDKRPDASTGDVTAGADAPRHPAGHLHFPLRGLAGEGAERAVHEALEGVPGILRIEVSSGMALAEVHFDEALVSAESVRTRLEGAGQRPTTKVADHAPADP